MPGYRWPHHSQSYSVPITRRSILLTRVTPLAAWKTLAHLPTHTSPSMGLSVTLVLSTGFCCSYVIYITEAADQLLHVNKSLVCISYPPSGAHSSTGGTGGGWMRAPTHHAQASKVFELDQFDG